MTAKLLVCMVLLLAACSESQHRTTGGIRSLADMGGGATDESCLDSFAGPVTLLDQDYGYSTTKIATWPDQARFDARGGRWTSLMNGYAADGDRDNTAPVQFGLDWGTNVDGSGRRDLWSAQYNTPPQALPMCFSGGVIVGTQPLDATWRRDQSWRAAATPSPSTAKVPSSRACGSTIITTGSCLIGRMASCSATAG